jgi:hypothetical protein
LSIQQKNALSRIVFEWANANSEMGSASKTRSKSDRACLRKHKRIFDTNKTELFSESGRARSDSHRDGFPSVALFDRHSILDGTGTLCNSAAPV